MFEASSFVLTSVGIREEHGHFLADFVVPMNDAVKNRVKVILAHADLFGWATQMNASSRPIDIDRQMRIRSPCQVHETHGE